MFLQRGDFLLLFPFQQAFQGLMNSELGRNLEISLEARSKDAAGRNALLQHRLTHIIPELRTESNAAWSETESQAS